MYRGAADKDLETEQTEQWNRELKHFLTVLQSRPHLQTATPINMSQHAASVTCQSVRAGCYGNSVGVDSYLKWSPSASTVSICIPPIRLKTMALWPPSTAHRRPTPDWNLSSVLQFLLNWRSRFHRPEAPTQEHEPQTDLSAVWTSQQRCEWHRCWHFSLLHRD